MKVILKCGWEGYTPTARNDNLWEAGREGRKQNGIKMGTKQNSPVCVKPSFYV